MLLRVDSRLTCVEGGGPRADAIRFGKDAPQAHHAATPNLTGKEDKRVPPIDGRRRVFSAADRGPPPSTQVSPGLN